jgi:hypothetical protein
MRDPLDSLFSCYKIKFGSNAAVWTLSTETLVAEYALYLETLQHFRRELPGRVVDVSYEALVAAPESTLRALLSRLGLPWDASVLRHHDRRRVVHTASALQVDKKLYTHSVGGWRRYAHQLRPLVAELQRHLPRLRAANALVSAAGARSILGQVVSSSERVAVNWELREDFDYGSMLRALGDSTAQSSPVAQLL